MTPQIEIWGRSAIISNNLLCSHNGKSSSGSCPRVSSLLLHSAPLPTVLLFYNLILPASYIFKCKSDQATPFVASAVPESLRWRSMISRIHFSNVSQVILHPLPLTHSPPVTLGFFDSSKISFRFQPQGSYSWDSCCIEFLFPILQST